MRHAFLFLYVASFSLKSVLISVSYGIRWKVPLPCLSRRYRTVPGASSLAYFPQHVPSPVGAFNGVQRKPSRSSWDVGAMRPLFTLIRSPLYCAE
ncbi:hypothetical protein CPB85DRAFT_1321099 [Mucidula mucida]|nr:hypothetical protein CPB85DRAFT_1321099 [Mucidula mucida]